MSSFTEIIVLCEDRQQEVFARRFLISCGVNKNKIRPKICPKGKLAGEQYVREKFLEEVRAYRSRSAYLNIGLVVLTDADIKTIHQRRRELEEALDVGGQGRREAMERIAIFIPKRNVETWIHFLMGEDVNETNAYKKFSSESECASAVARLAAKSEYRLTADVPPSLRAACDELQRIFPTKRCVELAD